eukprot:scaffold36696_cov28-Prasinocladus_malaysianus.AAC.1
MQSTNAKQQCKAATAICNETQAYDGLLAEIGEAGTIKASEKHNLHNDCPRDAESHMVTSMTA